MKKSEENAKNAMKIVNAVKEYQCSGCTLGCSFRQYGQNDVKDVACNQHSAGTFLGGIGRILLGLPTGFNRYGNDEHMTVNIFNKFEDGWGYNEFNMPLWKHKNKSNHTIVRGICPRVNNTWIHIFLEDCMDKINAIEITKEKMEEMD